MNIEVRLFTVLSALLIGLTVNFESSAVFAQGTAFNYQGRLDNNGAPASGNYDLRFAIYDSAAGGNQIGNLVTNPATAVSNGLFVVAIDFGPGVFMGGNYWLDIALRTNGAASFSELTPRQPIMPAPYAWMSHVASNLLGNLPAAQLSGAISTDNLPTSLMFSGTVMASSFSGNGAGLTNLNPTNLSGGTAATSSTNQFVNQKSTGTNLVLVASGNTAGAVFLTNYQNAVPFNGGSGNVLVFANVNGISNVAGIVFSTNLTDGTFGGIIMLANHGGPGYPGDASGNELLIPSSYRVCIDPGVLGDGGALQLGASAFRSAVYLQGLNYFVNATNAQWSVPLFFRAPWYSNGAIIDDKFFGTYGRHIWNKNEAQLQTFLLPDGYDMNHFDPGNFYVTEYRMWGTNQNNNTLYWGQHLTGGTQTSGGTNYLDVGTNGVVIQGNLTDTNQASDAWFGPDYFQAGTSEALYVQANSVLVGLTNGNSDFRVLDASGFNRTIHSYFLSGPKWGGSFFPKGGVAIGQPGSVTNSGDQLEVFGSASVKSIHSFQNNLLAVSSISVSGSPFFWTNTQNYNLTVNLTGGALQGVGVNGSLWASAVTNACVSVPLQPGEWMSITNTTAPAYAAWKPF